MRFLKKYANGAVNFISGIRNKCVGISFKPSHNPASLASGLNEEHLGISSSLGCQEALGGVGMITSPRTFYQQAGQVLSGEG